MSLAPRYVSACLITKDPVYPPEILAHVGSIGFGELLVFTNCDSPHRKQELFAKAAFDYIFYQDDDCIAPIAELFRECVPEMITCAMKPRHIESYAASRIALLGWGSLFPKTAITVLERYRKVYGEDHVYRRETERIMTYFNFPQRRLALPIRDLPSAWAADRLSMQPGHYDFIPVVEARCAQLLSRAGGV
jgi:hypothetical protein